MKPLLLNLDFIADDNIVNIAEKAAGFAISGETLFADELGSCCVLPAAGATVTVGTAELTTTSSGDQATWRVNVPANARYLVEPSVNMTVSASKAGLEPYFTKRTVVVDLTPPTAPTYPAPPTPKVGVAIPDLVPSTTSPDDIVRREQNILIPYAADPGIVRYEATGLPSGLRIDTGFFRPFSSFQRRIVGTASSPAPRTPGATPR